MFNAFFQRKDMERVVWHILNQYKALTSGSSPSGKYEAPIEAAIIGIASYCAERRISVDEYYSLYIMELSRHIERNGAISLEKLCYYAASLRGDFSENKQKVGIFLGESAKMLKLDVSVFENYSIDRLTFESIAKEAYSFIKGKGEL